MSPCNENWIGDLEMDSSPALQTDLMSVSEAFDVLFAWLTNSPGTGYEPAQSQVANVIFPCYRETQGMPASETGEGSFHDPFDPSIDFSGFPLASQSGELPAQNGTWRNADVGGLGEGSPGAWSLASTRSSASSADLGSFVPTYPFSPENQSSCASFSPSSIFDGHKGELGTAHSSSSASPPPPVSITRIRKPENKHQKKKPRGRKPVAETKRKQRQNDKPEKCEVCGRGSAYTRDLKRHVDTHNLDRVRIPCPVESCSKSFPLTQRHNLKRHLASKAHKMV